MNRKYSEQEKQHLINRYLSGTPVKTIVAESGVSKGSLYLWIKKHNETQRSRKMKMVSITSYRALERKNERLEDMIKILKTASCTATAPLQEKLAAAESLYGQYHVRMICEALDVSRGTFYNHILRNKRNNTYYAKRREELRIKIREIYEDSRQIFGAEKITAILKSNGERVSKTTVLDLMRDMGIESIRQSAKSLYLKNNKGKANLLKQNFKAEAPNRVWVSDVTCFKCIDKTYYVCVILDLFSRMIVGYKISLKNSTQLTKSTFKQAYESRNPQGQLMFHSDRGSNYISFAFSRYLQSLGVKQSFSRTGVPYDNSVVESFFKAMKTEELYRTNYRSENEFRKGIDRYVSFYNTKRPHKTLGYRTPAQMEVKKQHDSANLSK